MAKPDFIPLPTSASYSTEEMRQRAMDFAAEMQQRRSVRLFSTQPVPQEVIANCLQAAVSAPSGANQQPWHFVVITHLALKQRIRKAAEAEEHEFYTRRATPQWLAALEPLGTGEHKPFLETAPYLIAIFVQTYGILSDGKRIKLYYAHESTGIAAGMLITALHHAGLATLTHTPSPMSFLNHILERPANEKPFLLLVTGYPAEDAMVPVLTKKAFEEMVTFV